MGIILRHIKSKQSEKRMREIEEANKNIGKFNKKNEDYYGNSKYKIVFKDDEEKKKEGIKYGK